MDVNAPEFEAHEAAFLAIAEEAIEWESEDKPALDSCPLYLCLYGENGLDAREEIALLERLKTEAPDTPLYRLDVEADYYQDVILFQLAD